MLGGGAGHIADMIARYKSNMSMLSKKRYFNKTSGKYENRRGRIEINENKVNLTDLKIKLQQGRRREQFRDVIILLVSIFLAYILFSWIFF
ncbi:MAG: hypothetical protein KQI35_18050 [Bacteroidetes bacterium]|nr:hypothetical protein [Bacteroidota bacterium]